MDIKFFYHPLRTNKRKKTFLKGLAMIYSHLRVRHGNMRENFVFIAILRHYIQERSLEIDLFSCDVEMDFLCSESFFFWCDLFFVEPTWVRPLVENDISECSK